MIFFWFYCDKHSFDSILISQPVSEAIFIHWNNDPMPRREWHPAPCRGWWCAPVTEMCRAGLSGLPNSDLPVAVAQLCGVLFVLSQPVLGLALVADHQWTAIMPSQPTHSSHRSRQAAPTPLKLVNPWGALAADDQHRDFCWFELLSIE